jgi:hypothetical protein
MKASFQMWVSLQNKFLESWVHIETKQTFSLVEVLTTLKFKALPLASEEHGPNYCCGEKLA